MSRTSPVEQIRYTLAERLARARHTTDSLFQMLSPEALLLRPIPERHRILFYIGHLEAFDWNLIGGTTFGLRPFNESFDNLFAFGIDPVDGALPNDLPSDWPSKREVDQYVSDVRQRTDRLLDQTRFDLSDELRDGKIFEVAIEHRLMHAETLAYMLHWLPTELKHGPRRQEPTTQGRPIAVAQASIPDGTATLGLSTESQTFGWDNEFDLTAVHVPAFTIDTLNVTNGQFLEFVRSGGYQDSGLWSDEGWAWISKKQITHPRFWTLDNGAWSLRTMFDSRPLPMNWPVYVSHAEASAYARWAEKSLPTEAQWHRAAYATHTDSEHPFPWGDAPPDPTYGNFDFARWNPSPVGSYPRGNSTFGVSDLLGNGWDWTSTLFEPFEGFEPFTFYPGYSADFFDGKHYVMKGGSSQTSACMLRRSFRNWFQPHYPNIYATFRCVQP